MIAAQVWLGLTTLVTGAVGATVAADEGVPASPTSWIQFGAFSAAVALGAYLLARSDRREKRITDEFQAKLNAKDLELAKLRARLERTYRQQMRGGMGPADTDED